MEPTENTLVFRATINAVDPIRRKNYISGFGDNAVFTEAISGWKIVCETFSGSIFALEVEDKPDFKPGDTVTVTLRDSKCQV